MATLLQPAFVLHRRPYRETSIIVELFTQDHGRVAAVARGVRKARSPNAFSLQPFIPLLLSWYGKGELLTLSQIETQQYFPLLSGRYLRCGLYLNELLLRLLAKNDAHSNLFSIYAGTLKTLQIAAAEEKSAALAEKALRLFEKKLLIEIGYGLPLTNTQPFNESSYYYFDAGLGFLPYAAQELQPAAPKPTATFSGKTLNALLTENFVDNQSLQEVKRLMRCVFAALLGRPLESRQLFAAEERLK